MNDKPTIPEILYDIDTKLPKENPDAQVVRGKFAGKLICIPKEFLDMNKSPRKPRTHGGRDWAMVHRYLKDNPEMEGMPYEEYLKRGGGYRGERNGQQDPEHINHNMRKGWQYVVRNPNY